VNYWQLKINRPYTGNEIFDLRTHSAVSIGDDTRNDIAIDSTKIPSRLKVVSRGFRDKNKILIQLTDEVAVTLSGSHVKTKEWKSPLYSGSFFEATGPCEWRIGNVDFKLSQVESIPIGILPPEDRSLEKKHWRQSVATSVATHACLFLVGFMLLFISKFFDSKQIRPEDLQKVSIVEANKVFPKLKSIEAQDIENPKLETPVVIAKKEAVELASKPAGKNNKAPGKKGGPKLPAAKGLAAAKPDVSQLGLAAFQTTANSSKNNLDVQSIAKGSMRPDSSVVANAKNARLGIANGDFPLANGSGASIARLEGSGVESYQGGLGEKVKQGSFRGATIRLVKREVEIRGGLDPAVIRQIIEERLPEVRYCYETALLKETNLQGKIAASWTIQADGSVTGLTSESDEIKANVLHPCIKEQIKNWKFPSPKGGGVVHVKYPFLFSPLGS
jgi:hypothetical protein